MHSNLIIEKVYIYFCNETLKSMNVMKTNKFNTKQLSLLAIFVILSTMQFGCSKDENNINGAKKGSIVYTYSDKVHVVNLATGKDVTFGAVPYNEGAVSVSTDGTIAQLQQRDLNPEGALVRITKLDGTIIKEITIAQESSFVTSGARISPDASKVAFSLYIQLGSGKSTIRTYALDIKTSKYIYWDYTNWPGWTADNRLVVADSEGNQIYKSNAAVDFIDPINPKNLLGIEAVEAAPDGSTVLFSNKSGVRRSFAMNVATGKVTQLLSDGTGQYYPLAANGSLFYVQECCAGTFTLPAIHQIPFTADKITSSPIAKFNLQNSAGERLRPIGRYGYTPSNL
jgi:hypothetical protein